MTKLLVIVRVLSEGSSFTRVTMTRRGSFTIDGLSFEVGKYKGAFHVIREGVSLWSNKFVDNLQQVEEAFKRGVASNSVTVDSLNKFIQERKTLYKAADSTQQGEHYDEMTSHYAAKAV